MKKWMLFCLLVNLFAASAFSQNISGKWMGKLNVGVELRIVFNISQQGDSLVTTLDSPDQGAYGIPTAKTTLTNNLLDITIPAINGGFKGNYNPEKNEIAGVWMQGGSNLPVNLVKVDTVEPTKRLQTPVKPYPYKEEEVTFQNKMADSVTLAGTLTIPEGNGPFKAVVLVTGSGPQNRNEALLGHEPFLVLSDYLTRKGIIVLRYDDRGIAKSTGNFETATSADFATDANAAVNYLKSRKDLNISEIGIAGHSEGGLIAPLAASQNKNVDFIVLIAGPGIAGDSILNLQGDLIAKASGYSEPTVMALNQLRHQIIQVVKTETDTAIMAKKIIALNKEFLLATSPDVLEEIQMTIADSTSGIDFYANSWMKYFLTYDPRPALEKIKIPVLAINGTTDLQVPYKENLGAIEKALQVAGNKNYKIVPMENLNHLFQTSNSGSPMEYATNAESFNEHAMMVIGEWILSLK